MTIPNPNTTPELRWAAEVRNEWPLEVPILTENGDWRYWADRVSQAPSLVGYTIPRSENFESMRAWMRGFMLAYGGSVL